MIAFMPRVPFIFAFAAGVLIPTCQGQWLSDQVNFRRGELGGVRLYGVSAYSGYSTSASPSGIGPVPFAGALLDADVQFGSTATLGWQHHRSKTDFSLMYSGSYSGMVHYSDANGYSQGLFLAVNRNLTPRWTLGVSASGQDSTTAQYMFQPSNLSVISQLPGSLDDLAAAFSIGRFADLQSASQFAMTPLLPSSARIMFLGNRVLSYSAQASANYARSSRLSFHFTSFTAEGRNRDKSPQQNYIMPRSTGASAGMGMSYSLSPRTDIGFNVEETIQRTGYQRTNITSASASFGRKMGMRWFLRLHGGWAKPHVARQLYGTPTVQNAVGGGSLGVQLQNHTLLASYDRSVSDPFGFAVGTNTVLMGAWNWHHRGSRWNLFANFEQEQVRNTGFASLSGWRAGGGVSSSLNSQTSWTAQYVYGTSVGRYLGVPREYAIHSVQVSLSWSPQPVLR